jgi:hypothetical protein
MSNTQVKVPSIQVGGGDKLYNGKIYYFDYKFNFGDSPNILQVNVIEEKGNYSLPKIDLTEKKSVMLDGFDLGQMIAFKYKKRVSSQGNVLEIYFIDETYVLDKIFIGLVSRHGWSDAFDTINKEYSEKTYEELIKLRKWGEKPKDWSSSSSSPFQNKNGNFYLIGRLFHPCDTNKDNLISFDEATNFDYCDPCPACPEDKYETRCQELTYTQIFEVGYSLKDLEDMFNEKPVDVDGINITIDFAMIKDQQLGKKSAKQSFYRDYSGTLREVLTAWCNDFGLIWWYDPPNQTIKFLDVSQKEIELKSDDVINKYKNKNLISYEMEKTSENTVKNAVISWYQRGGEKAEYTCEKATTVVLSALYGADFLGNRFRETLRGTELNANHDVLGAILGAYNPILRNVFWQRQAYDLRSASDYAEMIIDLTSGISSSSSSFGSSSSSGEDDDPAIDNKTIYEMGNAKILAVIAKPVVEGASAFHNSVKNKWEELSTNPTLSEYEIKKIREKNAFFIVTYMDEDALEKRLELESEVYDFVGKFFVREHMFRLCGITGNDEFVRNNTNIESADGSAQIYSKKDGIGTNPLSRYKYYKSGYLGCVMGTGNISTGRVAAPQSGSKVPPSESQGFKIEEYQGNVVLKDTHNEYREAEKQAGTLFSTKYSDKFIPRFEQTAIVLERDAMWIPETQIFQDTYGEYIVENYGDAEWKMYGSDGVPVSDSEWLEKALKNLSDGRSGKVKIFIVYKEKKKMDIVPFEEKDFKQTKKHSKDKIASVARKMLKRIGGKHTPETPIGLLNNECHKIKIDDTLEIETPPHTFIKEGFQGQRQLIKKDVVSKGKNNNDPCDKGASEEIKFRKPAYRVYVSQSFDQRVTLPRIQTGVSTGMNPSNNVMKLNVLYNAFTDDDLFAFTGSGVNYGCIPNIKYLTGLHEAYTSRVYSNEQEDENLIVELKGLPEFEALETEIKRGLNGFSIQLNEEGSRSTLQYNTVLIKNVSSELTKWWNTKTAVVGGRRVNR